MAQKKPAKKSSKKTTASESIDLTPELAALSDRHRLFVLTYLKNGMNATAAYRTCYPQASEDTANANGPRLLVNAGIAKAIRAELDRIIGEERLQIERLVWRNLKEVLEANLSDYLDDEGHVDINAVRDKNPGAVVILNREIRQSEGGTVIRSTVKLDDRAKAREHALKLLGLLKEEGGTTPVIILPIHEVVDRMKTE